LAYMMRGVLILLACCRCASALNPSLDVSQYAHTAWKIRDGFFKGVIWSVAQTPDGYLWLGTTNGLLRFDGVRSVPWQPPAGDRLPSDYITNVFVARDGRLWIGMRGGLASWKDGKLTNYPEFAGQIIGQTLEDRDGIQWVSSYNLQSSKLCAIRSSAVRCFGEDGRFGPGLGSLYEDKAGNLWAGGLASLWRWKPEPPVYYKLPDPELQVHGLIEDDKGGILIGLRSGIRRLVNGKTEELSLPVKQVGPKMFLRDREGGLWIGTESGLLHIHDGRTDHFGPLDGLSGDVVASLFEDREGNIWVSTFDGGLDRFRDYASATISQRQGLSGQGSSLLGARDGSVWLGTATGLNRWRDGQITTYRKQSSALPDDYVDSLFQDGRGRILVFTLRGDAYFENGRFVRVSGVPGRYVRAVIEDTEGSLWISHDQALFHLVEGRVAERIPWSSLGRKDWAVSLVHDSARGGLWLGFYEGGVAFFKDGQVRASYGTADGLGGGIVGQLQLDRDGRLWAATEGGLSRLKDGRMATLTGRNGLPCDAVQWMMEDDGHGLWLSTACGLVRMERPELDAWSNDPKRTPKVTVLDSYDGFIGAGLVSRVAKSPEGRLWFTTLGGVGVVDPRHLPFNRLPPPVHIEEIIADRKTYNASSKQRLAALTRDLEIDYTALSLVAPEKNRFRVKLEGRDPDWKDVGNERKAIYTDLPPRDYRFRVRASNNSGVWNEAGDSFDFSIAPAYYQTAWFQVSCTAAFLGLLWALYRYRLYQIAQQFNTRLDERTRIARELHDTLLQSFHGLMFRYQAARNMLPRRPEEAMEALDEALERSEQAIAEGRDAIHNLRASTTVTNELAQAVTALGAEMSREMAAHDSAPNLAKFHVVVEGAPHELHPILRDEVYSIAREAVRNAFRHAQAHDIEVEITYHVSSFRLRVRDDGKGIHPAIVAEGRAGHYGVPGMRERAKRIGGKLDIWAETGAGTEVELSIPGSIAYGTSVGSTVLGRLRKKVVNS
jgi:signal transduction histidine kinase/ligand-binding sensor domain-containing protein